MLEESRDAGEIIARVAALDIGKAEFVCCVRVPGAVAPRRLQEVSTYSTMTGVDRSGRSAARPAGDERVVIESTSDYWKPFVRHEALEIEWG